MYSISSISMPIVLLLQRRIYHKQLLLGQCIQRNIVSSTISTPLRVQVYNYKPPLVVLLSQRHYGNTITRRNNNYNNSNNTKRSSNNSFYTEGKEYSINTFYSIYIPLKEWLSDNGNMAITIGCSGLSIIIILLFVQYEPKDDTINTNIEKQNMIINKNKNKPKKKKKYSNPDDITYYNDE